MGKLRKFLEEYSPTFLGTISAIFAIYWFWIKGNSAPIRTTEVLASVINISAIAVGFLTTAKSIIITANSETVAWLKTKADYYDRLLKYFMSAIWLCLTLAVSSSITLLLNPAVISLCDRLALIATSYFAVAAGTACFRVISIFSTIIAADSKPQKKPA